MKKDILNQNINKHYKEKTLRQLSVSDMETLIHEGED